MALVGSHAREDANEDSDVDLVILTTNLEKYFLDESWVSIFGEPEGYRKKTMANLRLCASFMRVDWKSSSAL